MGAFQSTRLRLGATARPEHNDLTGGFQSTRLRLGATWSTAADREYMAPVSIHAPAIRRDTAAGAVTPATAPFQSTRLRLGAT